MKKYYVYFAFHVFFASLALYGVFRYLMGLDNTLLIFLGVLLLPLGILQLLTGIYFLTKPYHYPLWLVTGMNRYWLITGFYFLLLFVIATLMPGPGAILNLWLFGVPWFIAIYQFLLVQHYAVYRKKQLLGEANLLADIHLKEMQSLNEIL